MKMPIAFSILLFASSACAQDAKLIAAGKKDGKVVIYGSMGTDIFEGIQQGFEKKTGIKVDYWRAAGATVLERASSDEKAIAKGARSVDGVTAAELGT